MLDERPYPGLSVSDDADHDELIVLVTYLLGPVEVVDLEACDPLSHFVFTTFDPYSTIQYDNRLRNQLSFDYQDPLLRFAYLIFVRRIY